MDRNDICSIVQVLDGTYRTAMKEVAAQAQEIKTMKDTIDSDKNAGIPIDALHVACRERDQAKKHIREIALTLDPHDSGAPDEGVVWLTKNYVKNVAESLAAKDRIISEQAAVIERARECIRQHGQCGWECNWCDLAESLAALPAPKPDQEPKL